MCAHASVITNKMPRLRIIFLLVIFLVVTTHESAPSPPPSSFLSSPTNVLRDNANRRGLLPSDQSSSSITPRQLTSTVRATTLASSSLRTARTTNDPLEWIRKCPCRVCETETCPSSGDNGGGRLDFRILCDHGALQAIPVLRMEPRLTLIEIDAPESSPNNLTLGPLFYRFPELRILRVRRSGVPAIGRTTFKWPVPLAELDLSHNRITFLEASDFLGLRDLRRLELSDNHLRDLPSGVFHHLTNLVSLNLSQNKLQTITTRLFYNLTSLASLDLSYNSLGDFAPQNAIDLAPLRELHLVGCELKLVHALFYQNLPNIELLDLRNNHLEVLRRVEFRYLKKLRYLRLDGNQLTTLPELAFFGTRLELLSLSENRLESVSKDTFSNTTVVELNLAGNNLTKLSLETFRPLATSLRRLNLAAAGRLGHKESHGPSRSLANLLAPLQVLEEVNLANLSLDSASGIVPEMFSSLRASLVSVNLSHNILVNMSARLIADLMKLELLDISYNSIYELSGDFLYALAQMPALRILRLEGNPWSCYRCHLLPLRNWLASKPAAYWRECEQDVESCAVCNFPPSLAESKVHQLEEHQLEWCTDPSVQLRMSTTEPNVGLVLALLIIIILIIVIIAVIIYYRNRGAIYFTNEDLLYPRTSNGSAPVHHGERTMSEDKSTVATNESRVFNVSNAIRYFADATNETPGGSLRSVDSFNSAAVNGDPRVSLARHAHIARGSNGGLGHTLPRRGPPPGVAGHSAMTGGRRTRRARAAETSIDSTRYLRTESSDYSHSVHLADEVDLRRLSALTTTSSTHQGGTASLGRKSTDSAMSRAKRKSLERLEIERKREEAEVKHHQRQQKKKAKNIVKNKTKGEKSSAKDETESDDDVSAALVLAKQNDRTPPYQKLKQTSSTEKRSSSSGEQKSMLGKKSRAAPPPPPPPQVPTPHKTVAIIKMKPRVVASSSEEEEEAADDTDIDEEEEEDLAKTEPSSGSTAGDSLPAALHAPDSDEDEETEEKEELDGVADEDELGERAPGIRVQVDLEDYESDKIPEEIALEEPEVKFRITTSKTNTRKEQLRRTKSTSPRRQRRQLQQRMASTASPISDGDSYTAALAEPVVAEEPEEEGGGSSTGADELDGGSNPRSSTGEHSQ